MEDNKVVKVWVETTSIPTYEVGEADKNPMFLDKRVYQGSSGKVYPFPVIDKIYDHKKLKDYQMVYLENEYLKISIMPEIGGRIYRAIDKTNNYDFVYYNQVIKPALVGLAGPWISGGIEFNWPQHHRPNTFGPVEYTLEENKDGSATVWVSEIDRMYGTKMTAGFTLYPGKAYLEIEAQLYNRTSEPQTFLWWANPAVAVNDHTQSVFPPDVNAVLDHGKRDVSRFPIATGTYYKKDYSEGVDISRYKNVPVPTSYMAYKSDYNFVGGYDHKLKAGLLHVANHHISPGKKQWTWGSGDFGQAWDRSLTDEDGPYIELMTGVYTDNQPDFTWLKPYEEKSFKQYFMPYKDIGVVKNASTEAAVNLEIDDTTNEAFIYAYTTSYLEKAIVELKGRERIYFQEEITLSPENTFKTIVPLLENVQAHNLMVSIKNSLGKTLIAYQPKAPAIEEVPDPAKALPEPEELKTNEELYLAGLHLEQYRHATYEPDPYYLEGLKRDASDIRINIAYGTLLLRRGLFQESEKHFRRAINSLTWKNPNPYDSEAYYQLGLSLKYQGELSDAYAAFHKAVWSAEMHDCGYFSLAQISCENKEYDIALDEINRSLVRNSHNYRARNLKSTILRKLGRYEEAENLALETRSLDILDFGAINELYYIYKERGEMEKASDIVVKLDQLMRKNAHNYLSLSFDYLSSGLFAEAIEVLERNINHNSDVYPMVYYVLGYLCEKQNMGEKAKSYRLKGKEANWDYCFPNKLIELLVLEHTIEKEENDDKAHYYLGNLLYDKKRFSDAIKHWEISSYINSNFATVHRNLSLGYFNKMLDTEKALHSLEVAFCCNKTDARVFYELDQLYKKINYSPQKRLDNLLAHKELIYKRDDLYIEYVTLLNFLGRNEEAIDALQQRQFHPWEGGEGKVIGQYVLANVELAKAFISKKNFEKAIELLIKALVYPENLGEGKLEGAQENNIYYYLGCAYEGLNQQDKANECYHIASLGLENPTSAMFYNDQPPEMIFYQGLAWKKLNNIKEANRRFNKLIEYGEKHLFDNIKIDYFAVSLPDFLVFDDNISIKNKIHCYFMIGLGYLGLKKVSEARAQFENVLELDVNHIGGTIHLQLVKGLDQAFSLM